MAEHLSILFCTPCYNGMMHARHGVSALGLKEALEVRGVDHEWDMGDKESLVHRARMEMTASFLRTGRSHMMWIDSDIELTADDVAKLWNLQVDIAVAAYSMKHPDKPLSAWKNGKLVKLEDCPKEPFDVDYAGTGFMLIRRTAILRVWDYLKERERACRELLARLPAPLSPRDQHLVEAMFDGVAADYEGQDGGMVPAVYMTPIHLRGLESEDYNFCRVAREAGMQVIMDPSIRLGHWGQFRYGA